MKRMLIVLIPCVLTTGCASALYTAAAASRARHRTVAYQLPAPPSPVARWDNVMMLEPATPLKVLTMDGTVVTGRFVSANIRTLRLDSDTTPTLGMVDVMRVDRLGNAPGAMVKEGFKGAAIGAGAAGVAGLLIGVAPPPRVFAGAAVLGAYGGAADAAASPGPGTIYLAASAVPVSGPSVPAASLVRR